MATPSAKPSTTVPADLTSFVGRRQDLSAVRQLFATTRLVTLTGIGGVGKTRLAYRVATEMRRAFPDGVYVVELASLDDPHLVPHTVMDALAIREQSPRPATTIVCDHLQSRRVLLVLDNCEHLIEAVSELADTVLRSAPDVAILATSRQALRLTGEHVYPVAPLGVPRPDETLVPGTSIQYPAVTLLAERTAAVLPGFRLSADNEASVVRLCHQLEGIPLAIELASTRLRVLTVDELADRLDDRFEMLREGSRNLPARHRTLQALIDWSHDLCTPQEQLLWARASVFAGGFTNDALRQVCIDDALPESALLDTISGLLDKSVFLREDHDGRVRFRMLETVRSYGQAQLVSSAEQHELSRRHRAWCLDLVETAGAEWVSPKQAEWAATLEREHANLRRALEFSLTEQGGARLAMRMAAIPWFWGAMGILTEGRLWLERALALDTEPSRERAWALATTAYISAFQGDDEAMTALAEEAHRIGVELDDPPTLAYSTHVLGMLHSLGDDPGSAIPLFVEAKRGYDRSDVSLQYADSLGIELAAAYIFTGQLDDATRIVEELFEQCEANGDRWNLSYALWGRGYIAMLRGDTDLAESDFGEALQVKLALHDTFGIAMVLELLAWNAVTADDAERAALLFGAVEHIWKSSGGRLFASRRVSYELAARAALGDEQFEEIRSHGGRLAVEEVYALALRDAAPPAAQHLPSGAPAGATSEVLTPRQREVAEMVAAGMSNKEIAAKLVISLRTAEGHVEGILAKLGFKTRAQIASWMTQQSTLPD